MSSPIHNIFADADIIHTYTRAQALTDGTLIAAPADLCRGVGFKVPVAITAAAHTECVEVGTVAAQVGNNLTGRWWDVLYMARQAAGRQRGESVITFDLYAVTSEISPSLVTLKMVIGPGDTGEPVITIMQPNED